MAIPLWTRTPGQNQQIIQIEHNIVKNSNWLEANQLAIYKRSRGFDSRTLRNKSR